MIMKKMVLILGFICFIAPFTVLSQNNNETAVEESATRTSRTGVVLLNNQDLYSFPVDDPSNLTLMDVTLPGSGEEVLLFAEYVDGLYYFLDGDWWTGEGEGLYSFNPETHEINFISYIPTNMINAATAIAWHPIEKKMYFLELGEWSIFGKIDLETGEWIYVGENRDFYFFPLAFTINYEGRAFALDAINNGISEVFFVSSTNVHNLLIQFDFTWNWWAYGDMEYDQVTNTIYFTVFNGDVGASQLYTFDVESNTISLIHTYSEELAATCLAFQDEIDTDTVTISGTITASQGGAPIEGVSVTYKNDMIDSYFSTTTNGNGNYSLEIPADVVYNIEVKKSGYKTILENVISFSENTIKNHQLVSPQIDISPNEINVSVLYGQEFEMDIIMTNSGDDAFHYNMSTIYKDGAKRKEKEPDKETIGFANKKMEMKERDDLSFGKSIFGVSMDESLINSETFSFGQAPFDFSGEESINSDLFNSKQEGRTAAVAMQLNSQVQGYYSFDFLNSQTFQKEIDLNFFPNCAEYYNGDYYIAVATGGLYKFNLGTGKLSAITYDNRSGGIAYNPVDGKMYGITLGDYPYLFTIDIVTGEETLVTALSNNYLLGMTITNEGRFLVIDVGFQGISEVNPTTGAVTLLISAGFSVNYGQDISIDRETNTVYWAALNAASIAAQLYKVNLDNYSLEYLGNFPNQATAFAIQNDNFGWLDINNNVMTLNPGETHTLTVSFDSEWAESGTFYADIHLNSNPDIAIDPIDVTFTILTSCDPPTNLTVVTDHIAGSCNAELSWDAPYEGASFNVYRDNTLIASNITATSYNDADFTLIVQHEWRVTTLCGTVESESATVTGICMPRYIITASAGSNGNITPSGEIEVIHGSDQTFTIVTNTSYAIDQVLIDGVNNIDAVNNSGYTFVNVTEPHTIHATFKTAEYTITATAGSGGTITPSGIIGVGYGDSRTFIFTQELGYNIIQVLIDGINNPNAATTGFYTFSNISANHTISVVFQHYGYPLTATAGAGGSIQPAGVTIINIGGNQLYTFTPANSFKTSLVLIDGVNNPTAVLAGIYQFTNVNSAHTINVEFELKTYDLIATVTGQGSITPSGTISVTHGENQSYVFEAGEGYHISQVLVDGVNNPDAVASGSYTFFNVTANHIIKAIFEINKYEIESVALEGGTIMPSGIVEVEHGGSKTYIITANIGYQITQVLVDGENNAAAVANGTYTFSNVKENHTIIAEFEKLTYSITACVNGDGGVISPEGNVSVTHGSEQLFTIIPLEGFKINQVLIDGINNAFAVATGYYTFTNISSNHTIVASFEKWTYSIVANVSGKGAILPDGIVTVEYGDDQIFNFLPDEGYQVTDVIIDGVHTGRTEPSYTFFEVQQNHTITALFGPNVSISDVEANQLTVYPNPTNGKLRIDNGALKIKHIQVLDIIGKLIHEFDNIDAMEVTLDFSSFSNGTYFINVDGKTVKVIKY